MVVVDPICGMEIDEATALRADRDGTSFYFCSEHCRQKFLGEHATKRSEAVAAEGYVCCDVKGAGERAVKAGRVSYKYVCPMCEGVESDQPGDCPKCGMALVIGAHVCKANKSTHSIGRRFTRTSPRHSASARS